MGKFDGINSIRLLERSLENDGERRMEKNQSLKWEEKYRPKKLDEIVGNASIIVQLKGYVKSKNLVDLFLYGVHGVGKTSAARCVAHELQVSVYYHNVSELMSTEKPGRLLFRSLTQFAKTTSMEPSKAHMPFKIAILDEVEGISKKIQDRILECMTHFHANVRFILICNDVTDKTISDKITSRCDPLKFEKVSTQDILQRLTYIATKENMSISQSELSKIAKNAKGSVRKAVMGLQGAAALMSVKPTRKKLQTKVASGKVGLLSAPTLKKETDNKKELTPEEIFGDKEIEKKEKSPLEERFEQLMATTSGHPESTNVRYSKPMYCRVQVLKKTKNKSVSDIMDKAVETLFDVESGLSHEELESKFQLERKTDLFKQLKSRLNDLRMINEDKYPRLEQMGSFDWENMLEGLNTHLGFLEREGDDKKIERLLTKYEINLIKQALEIIDKIDSLSETS